MNVDAPGPQAPDSRSVLVTARLVAGGLAAGVLILTVLAGLVASPVRLEWLAPPAALLGLVSPVIGYRLYALLAERVSPTEDAGARRGAFLRATVVALSVADGVAVFGIVAFALSGKPMALIGVLTHVILTGAIWPSEERLETFLESRRTTAGGGSP